MAKLSDIANEVGVSNKTVSMTLRGMKCASPEISRRIHEATAKFGYVPNQAARNMRLQESHFIGLLADMVATTPHSVELIRGAQAEAIVQNRHLLIGTLDNDPKAEEEFLTMFQSHRATGVIYATLHRCRLAEKPKNTALNVVMANCGARDNSGVAILPDDFGGGYLQAHSLLQLGHTRIGVISLSNYAPATQHRMRGIREAISEAGVLLDERMVREGIKGRLEYEEYVAYDVAMEMLSQPNRPTAIICGNDRIAMLVYSAAARLGIMIPEGLSVIGFDDFGTISEGMRPKLSTIELPYFEIGRRAVRAVLRGVPSEPEEETAPCKLVERESCAPPRL